MPAAPTAGSRQLFAQIPAMALAGLTAVCLVAFHPWTANSNLIKEMIWWPGLMAWAGLMMIAAPAAARHSMLRALTGAAGQWQRGVLLWAALGLWLVLESIRAPEPSRGWIVAARCAGYAAVVAAMIAVLHSPSSLRYFLSVVSWALLAVAAYTILQFFQLDFVRWADTSRPPGTFGNPNFTANLLGAWLPVVAVWEVWLRRISPSSRSGNRAGDEINTARFSWKHIPIRTAGMVAALLLTQSRAGLISLLAGLIALVLLYWIVSGRVVTRWLIRFSLCCVLMALVLAAAVVWFAPQRLGHVLNSVTVQIRLLLWENALALWHESPLLGHGLGSFAALSPRLNFRLEPIAGFKQALHAHSWFFEALMELGIVGLLLLLAALAALLSNLIRGAMRLPCHLSRLVAGAVAAGLLALLAGTSVDVWLNWWDGGWTFSLLAGLGLASLTTHPDHTPIPIKMKLGDKRLTYHAVPVAGICLLLLSMVAGVAAWNFWWSEFELRQGRALLEGGRYQEALNQINRSLARRPSAPDAPFYHAMALVNLGKTDRAEAAIKQVESNRPYFSAPPAVLSRLYLSRGLLAEAEAAQRRAWTLEPGARHAMDLAQILIATRRVADAVAVLETQLGRQVHPDVLHLYLKIERESGHERRARDFLAALRRDKSLSLHPKSRVELVRWEAELSSLMDEPARAMMAYQEALLLSPDNVELWNDYGLTLKRLRNYTRADAALTRAMALAPGNFVPAINRLELAIERGDTFVARRLVQSLGAMPLPPEARARVQSISANLTGNQSP